MDHDFDPNTFVSGPKHDSIPQENAAGVMNLQEDPFKGWGVDLSSSARIFAHSQNMSVTKKGSKTTHAFMAGGKMNLIETPANIYAFRLAAAQPNQLNTISEEAEEEFCAFFEIDPPDTWTVDHTDAFLPLVCVVFSLFCSGVKFLMYVSTKESGAKGMHIVVPQLCVTCPRMLKVRRYLIILLQRNPAFAAIDDWEPIIDKKVYTAKHSHMRMNFSYKAEQHHSCFRGGRYSSQTQCLNNPPCKHGYFYKPGNYYRVERVYRSDGTRDMNEEMLVSGPHLESRIKQLERTSIRHPTRILTTPFVTPLDCPPEIDETKKVYARYTFENQMLKTIGEDAKKYTLDPQDSVFQAIVDFIRNHSGRLEWKFIEVTDIKYTMTGKNNAFRKYFIYVNPKARGGTCCLNRIPNEFGIRQHKSAPIYFILTCQGLRQKCNAGAGKKNRVKVNGKVKPCTQFESNVISIRPSSLMRIFPPNTSSRMVEAPSRAPSRIPSISIDPLQRQKSISLNNSQTNVESDCNTCVVNSIPSTITDSQDINDDVQQSLIKTPEQLVEDAKILARKKEYEQKLMLLRWVNATKTTTKKSINNKSTGYGPVKNSSLDRRAIFSNSGDVRLAVASKFIAGKLQQVTGATGYHPYAPHKKIGDQTFTVDRPEIVVS